jgi:hypothetical protein
LHNWKLAAEKKREREKNDGVENAQTAPTQDVFSDACSGSRKHDACE